VKKRHRLRNRCHPSLSKSQHRCHPSTPVPSPSQPLQHPLQHHRNTTHNTTATPLTITTTPQTTSSSSPSALNNHTITQHHSRSTAWEQRNEGNIVKCSIILANLLHLSWMKKLLNPSNRRSFIPSNQCNGTCFKNESALPNLV